METFGNRTRGRGVGLRQKARGVVSGRRVAHRHRSRVVLTSIPPRDRQPSTDCVERLEWSPGLWFVSQSSGDRCTTTSTFARRNARFDFSMSNMNTLAEAASINTQLDAASPHGRSPSSYANSGSTAGRSTSSRARGPDAETGPRDRNLINTRRDGADVPNHLHEFNIESDEAPSPFHRSAFETQRDASSSAKQHDYAC